MCNIDKALLSVSDETSSVVPGKMTSLSNPGKQSSKEFTITRSQSCVTAPRLHLSVSQLSNKMGLYVLELKLFEQFFNSALPRADNINNERRRV